MDRRDSIKTLLIGTIGGATLAGSCKPGTEDATSKVNTNELYGRLPEELERDEKLMSEKFFSDHELATIAVLCDIILPATDSAGSATEAEVPAFIEFIAKDIQSNQLPVRGGLMWLDAESNKRFGKEFKSCGSGEQIEIVEDIAYPDPKDPAMEPGVSFFKKMRNLTLTGYYTSRMGIEDLGYQGNRPNVWDGVPEDVLKNHEVAYDEEWLAKCVDQSKRDISAEWDDQGNLIT